MKTLSPALKQRLARIVRLPIMQLLMRIAIHIIVPRHRVGVGAVVFNEDGHVLLLRHVFHATTPWGIPSGWLEGNEQPSRGVLRELEEETGVVASLGDVIHTAHTPQHNVVHIVYTAYALNPPTELSYEILEAAWFAPDRLPADIRPMTQLAIARGAERFNANGWQTA